MKTLLFAVISLSFNMAFASSDVLPQSICPALTEDASQILSNIQSLRDDINKEKDQCLPLDAKLASIAEVMKQDEWSDVKKALAGDTTVELEGETVDALAQSVEGVSQSIAETVAMISGSGANCIDESHKTTFLGKLSGVVKEVSSIAGQTSGPYGMAVSLGGQFLSAALRGIEKMLPSSVYNFKDPEDEELFMNQFCSYTELHKDIQDYLTLDTRQAELKLLDSYLKQKIEIIQENCVECDGVAIAWLANEKADKAIKQLREDLHIVEMGSDRDNVDYSRCGPIHKSFHTDNTHLDELITVLSEYKSPMMPESHSDYQYIQDIISNVASMGGYFPELDECTKPKEPEEDIQWAHQFNRYMRDTVVTIKDAIFGQHVRDFKKAADKKYVDELGDYTEKSLKRRKWVIKENLRVAKLLKPSARDNYELSAGKLESEREWLEKHFMSKHFPRYLKFMASRNMKDLKSISRMVSKLERNQKKYPDMDERVHKSEKLRILNKLEKNFRYTYTFSRYCEYVKYLEITQTKIESICLSSSRKIQDAYDKLAAKSQLVSEHMKTASLWVSPDGDYESATNRVGEYTDKLADWMKRGEERWCKKSDTSKLCEEKKVRKRLANCLEAGTCEAN